MAVIEKKVQLSNLSAFYEALFSSVEPLAWVSWATNRPLAEVANPVFWTVRVTVAILTLIFILRITRGELWDKERK